MKNFFLLIASLIVIFNTTAQDKVSLEFKDGTKIEGFGRIRADNTILYKKTKDSEKETYDYKTVEKMVIYGKDSVRDYEYKIIEGSGGDGSIILLEIVVKGRVSLYQLIFKGVDYDGIGPGGVGTGIMGSSTSKKYYLSKGGSPLVTNLGFASTRTKKFKKNAQIYFDSCPDLLEKIENKYFEKDDLSSVFEYYNEKCN